MTANYLMLNINDFYTNIFLAIFNLCKSRDILKAECYIGLIMFKIMKKQIASLVTLFSEFLLRASEGFGTCCTVATK